MRVHSRSVLIVVTVTGVRWPRDYSRSEDVSLDRSCLEMRELPNAPLSGRTDSPVVQCKVIDVFTQGIRLSIS